MSLPVPWLEQRLSALQKLSQLHATLREERHGAQQVSTPSLVIAIEDGLKEIRQKLLRETTWLTEQIGNRPGIDLAFIAHEGLVMAANGRLENHENYAAIANQFATEAIAVAKRLDLEPPSQVLMVASNRKLALIFVEEMILGIVAPREIELATLLAQV